SAQPACWWKAVCRRESCATWSRRPAGRRSRVCRRWISAASAIRSSPRSKQPPVARASSPRPEENGMGNVLLRQITIAIATVLGTLLNLYWWIVLIAVLLTWVNPDPYNPIVRFLRGVTEPVFYQVRRRMPFVIVGGWDLSPIVVMLGIAVLQIVVVVSLRAFAYRLDLAALGVAIG